MSDFDDTIMDPAVAVQARLTTAQYALREARKVAAEAGPAGQRYLALVDVAIKYTADAVAQTELAMTEAWNAAHKR